MRKFSSRTGEKGRYHTLLRARLLVTQESLQKLGLAESPNNRIAYGICFDEATIAVCIEHSCYLFGGDQWKTY